MLQELIQAVIKKTGLPETSAKQAVETVLAFLKERLPKEIGSHIDGTMTGASSGVAGIAKSIVGMFTGHSSSGGHDSGDAGKK